MGVMSPERIKTLAALITLPGVIILMIVALENGVLDGGWTVIAVVAFLFGAWAVGWAVEQLGIWPR